MSIDVSTEPVGVTTGSGDDDLDHIVCCNPNRALCGRDVSTLEWIAEGEDNAEDECVVCTHLYGSTCGASFCRMRQWWRERRQT
jgi:hypothetical protein